ncbi:fumarylacetoacetate hydrolase family protein [Burkholderia sp. SCN-KJ]|uniref:fumarylacetoacetate hydrolase family protein n=1 Tax=Burkholderia sp. SCN-KJ TaxID=2969248 RepID=UPI00214FAA1E|nr:fumarylacetoacetate hydrolase family protein [Burkholderia sp. SCN-KJ]MCR4470433.1 fumarylacetoacetate hydrolase family protein [Burkholderia sp. SCN-KJ]
MKFLTFKLDGKPQLGLVLDESTVYNLTRSWNDLFTGEAPRDLADLISSNIDVCELKERVSKAHDADHVLSTTDVEFMPPIAFPKKNVFCVGRNYREHIIEGNRAAGRDPHNFPMAPEFFSKPPTTVVGHGASVRAHADVTELLDYEVELGIVIGRRGTNIRREEALEYVFGYTVINDITARDLQKSHGQWFKGKALDTTCPIGPVVVNRSALPNAQELQLELYVNGELRQHANTIDMLFTVPEIIEQLSAGLTLEPGDIIATGTPSGVGFAMTPPRRLVAGDMVLARISGIGDLMNRIVD